LATRQVGVIVVRSLSGSRPFWAGCAGGRQAVAAPATTITSAIVGTSRRTARHYWSARERDVSEEDAMLIVTVLRTKGDAVVTVPPSATVRELLDTLAEHRIGAVVVSSGAGIAGIVSERDVVRRLRDAGAALLDQPVARIMTTEVVTCRRETPVDELMTTMTERRIRHVPVVDERGAIVGIVSIGDLVKSRISELESERDDLVGYIGTR
jgi:CBS domain-containing protein